MTMGADAVLKAAAEVADSWNHHWRGTEHLLVAYLEAERKGDVRPFLTEAGLGFDAAAAAAKEAVPPLDQREEGKSGVLDTPRLAHIRGFAHGWAAASGWPDPPVVTAEHLLLGLLVDRQGVGAQVIEKAGVNVDNVIVHMGNRLAS